jgi:general stress protein 26
MSTISRVDLLDFIRDQSLAVVASVSDAGAPEAAVVGVAVNDPFEVVFDALTSSRKARNFRARPNAALVIGGMAPGDERTVQYEGTADEPTLQDLELLKEFYFRRFPEGRQRSGLPGLTYLRLRPAWIRFSDYNQDPPLVVEFDEFATGANP